MSQTKTETTFCSRCGLSLPHNKQHWDVLSCLPDVNRAYRGFLSDLIWKDEFNGRITYLTRAIRFNQAQFDCLLKSYYTLQTTEQNQEDTREKREFLEQYKQDRIAEHLEMLHKKAVELASLGRKYYSLARL